MEATIQERVLQICDELGEDIDSPSCRALREYIKQCPHCQAFVDSVKKTIKLYRVHTPEYSIEIRKRLFKALELE